jgi:hypothetical protein
VIRPLLASASKTSRKSTRRQQRAQLVLVRRAGERAVAAYHDDLQQIMQDASEVAQVVRGLLGHHGRMGVHIGARMPAWWREWMRRRRQAELRS